eukprot:s59_g64.t1
MYWMSFLPFVLKEHSSQLFDPDVSPLDPDVSPHEGLMQLAVFGFIAGLLSCCEVSNPSHVCAVVMGACCQHEKERRHGAEEEEINTEDELPFTPVTHLAPGNGKAFALPRAGWNGPAKIAGHPPVLGHFPQGPHHVQILSHHAMQGAPIPMNPGRSCHGDIGPGGAAPGNFLDIEKAILEAIFERVDLLTNAIWETKEWFNPSTEGSSSQSSHGGSSNLFQVGGPQAHRTSSCQSRAAGGQGS